MAKGIMDGIVENRQNVVDRGARALVYAWLAFAVSALVVAGLFAVLVAMARTPLVQNFVARTDYVKIALVGHVNLSFVIWFVAFEGALWVLASTAFLRGRVAAPSLAWAGLIVSVAGTTLMTLSSVLALGDPLFINYVPVVDHWTFYAGLVVLAAGVVLALVASLLTAISSRNITLGAGERLLAYGAWASGAAVFVAVGCFLLSWYFEYNLVGAAEHMDLEVLFWGGGHILQFANTIAMVAVWLFLAALVFDFSMGKAPSKFLYGLFLVFVALSPLVYLFYDINDYGYRESFTRIMQWGLGPSTGAFGLAILAGVISGARDRVRKGLGALPWGRPEFSSLVMSMGLFLLGGLISFTIFGYNTKIPSHYHGVIGGVTTAFMGITYHLVERLGKNVYSERMARLQPYVYGIGQALFVVGMFWAGSHGVARKTFGAAQNLDDPAKIISMVVFGLGGMVAIAGGIMFIVNVGVSLLKGSDEVFVPSLTESTKHGA